MFTRPLELKQGKPAGKGTIMVNKVFVWKKWFLILSYVVWEKVTFLVFCQYIFKRYTCTGKIDICNYSFFHGQSTSKTLWGFLFVFFFLISVAQISAEEIKDTRVVYLEIEARNLDKKVLLLVFFF